MLSISKRPPLIPPSVALTVKNLPASAGDARDVGSIPGLGRPPGGGHGNPRQPGEARGDRSRVGYGP